MNKISIKDYNKKFSIGRKMAENDGYIFSAKSAIDLGACEEEAKQVENAIQINHARLAGGYFWMMEEKTIQLIGYISTLKENERAKDEAETMWFLNDPCGE